VILNASNLQLPDPERQEIPSSSIRDVDVVLREDLPEDDIASVAIVGRDSFPDEDAAVSDVPQVYCYAPTLRSFL
jgi:hypothetical protein